MEYRSSHRRFRRWWILAGTLVLLVGLLYAWRLQAQGPATQVAPSARGAGRLPALPVLTQPTDNEVRDMGGTFYFLEAKAKKVTARFADGMAIADRGLDGNIRPVHGPRRGRARPGQRARWRCDESNGTQPSTRR
jgi:hypothetical protein